MEKRVECVPNISAGRDSAVIDRVVAATAATGCQVLHVDPGAATNRTVITFVGSPEQVAEGAFAVIQTAAQLIDMRQHTGEHPRIGATDVCPFIPLSGVSMDECVAIARNVGARVAAELGIPVYLYEEAATTAARKSLAYIREGEYEGLAMKLRDPLHAPDFGKPEFHPRSGATVIGARPFLIAYNINLATRSKRIATRIAEQIRESGYKQRGPDGKILKDSAGNPTLLPGRFRACRAVGWFIEEYGIAQVSINLTDFSVTGLHHVFDEVERLAGEFGVRVTGSEIVGLVPRQALLDAGRHYLRRQKRTLGVAEAEVLHTAIRALGLSDVQPFDPKKRIVEELLVSSARLVHRSVEGFTDLVATDTPAPGGGSVSALAGALAAALAAMVAGLSFEKVTPPEPFEGFGREAHEVKTRLLQLVDADSAAFEAIMTASRSKDPAAKPGLLLRAYTQAIAIPQEVAERSLRALTLAHEVLGQGLPSAASDVAVAGALAWAAIQGALANVRINLLELEKQGLGSDATSIITRAKKSSTSIRTQATLAFTRFSADVDRLLWQ